MNSFTIALNMLRRSLFQRKGLLLYLVMPVTAVSLIIGILGKQTENQINIAYLNLDSGSIGMHISQELAALPDYRLKQAESEEDLKSEVIKQKVNAAFIIPAGFSETILSGAAPQLDMYQLSMNEATISFKMKLDSILSGYQATIASSSMQGLQGAALTEAVEKTIQQIQKHQVKSQITDLDLYTNPNVRLVIGFMLMFMMALINNTVSLVMEDRRLRTMARTFTAPVRSHEIVLGNFLGSFVVGTLQVLVILVITRYVAQYEYGLPFVSQFVILEFFLLATMGIASAAASMVKNTTNMSVINSLIITPTCMLGGCFWPISLMPDWMQKLANFVPQKWALDAITHMGSGQPLSQMWMHMGVLALFALILMSIGAAILKPDELEVS
ncbi:ABC transporter [Paenibacillus sp. Soil766]|uniref:ABC transporter permease n=1 Tax=Paenibacillus sp. Soil766 TaxID=1736404 RepID=UPI00070B0F7E|nr:ABC transporter permease [Paenibacillus sp. Soil766]KRE90500.1 ABC transporter [Paenibacillus sp. Soil766]